MLCSTSTILGTNGLTSADVPLSNKQTIYVDVMLNTDKIKTVRFQAANATSNRWFLHIIYIWVVGSIEMGFFFASAELNGKTNLFSSFGREPAGAIKDGTLVMF